MAYPVGDPSKQVNFIIRERYIVNEKKQVEKDHYDFLKYMDKARWNSVWHQLDEVIRLKPRKVLEIGPGPGVLKAVASKFGIHVETLDLDHELRPDFVGSATSLPFKTDYYDVVCAFQILEHLPYQKSLQALAEMARVARRNIIISLPDAKIMWRYQFYVPKVGVIDFCLPRPFFRKRVHAFNGEHYWEINKIGYSFAKIVNDFGEICNLEKSYRVPELLEHRFFIFNKKINI